MRLVATTDEGKVLSILANVEDENRKSVFQWVVKAWVKDRKRLAKELSSVANPSGAVDHA
jgi:hypothetical protein